MRRFWFFLALFVISACASSPPPKPENALVVGDGNKGSNPVAAAAGAAPEDDLPVPIAADDPVRGPRDAYVTIVVFSDFQCPFCTRVATTFEQIRETYGDDVRIVFKNEPLSFHKHAGLAAEVGAAVFALAGNDAFWRFHDMAFRRQQLMSPDTIRQWAIAAGADSREVEAGIERGRWAAKVAKDHRLATQLDVSGTPNSFVNGIHVSGAQAFEKWKVVIDAELARAKDIASRGVERDRVYARLVADNFKAPKDDDDDDRRPPTPDVIVWRVPVGSSPVRGNANALVTIVEFADFQCPFCKKSAETLERVRAHYGDKIRVVWKDEPLSFHARAIPAAQLARSARQQKGDAAFWTVHDKLFDSHPALEDSDLEAVAKAAGIDVAKAMAAVKAKTFTKPIDDDISLADDLQATGTPHYFVNGRRMVGAQAFEKFKEVIDQEIAKAEALVNGGVARAALYDTILKDAKGAPEPERKTIAMPSATAPFRGAANAKVVIQEFSDFQCPFCKRVEPTIDELLKAYPGKIKVVWRNVPLPFHNDAPLAAEAAREAYVQKGNEGFTKMHDLLFQHQGDQDGIKRAALDGYAAQIGLDTAKFAKALDDRTHKNTIEAEKKMADDGGVQGTPAFTIGPYFLSGAQPLVKFKKLVDRVLTEPAQPPSVTAPSGLVTKDLVMGSGREVKSGDHVKVHYVGTLTDGKEFDSSRGRNQPFEFDVGGGMVIKGWEQGLLGMKVGGKRKLTIPPDLAYGDRGVPPKVPAKATLVFEVELLEIR